MPTQLSITEYSGWRQLDDSEMPATALESVISESSQPDASQIPGMLRRRLNVLGKACAAELLKHLKQQDNLPIVYCSRHGDIARTTTVLTDMAKDEPMSPMHFSLAVHNAICGVVSIHQKLNANISTIAAADGMVPVLLEAAGLLHDGHDKVLCVLCDTPLPAIYANACGSDSVQHAFACSFIVTRESDLAATKLQLQALATAASADAQPLDFIAFLESQETEFHLSHNGMDWQVAKLDS